MRYKVLSNLKDKLHHLLASEQDEIISDFTVLFSDVRGRTECVLHDVDVGDVIPIKQHSYRVNTIELVFEEGNRITL